MHQELLGVFKYLLEANRKNIRTFTNVMLWCCLIGIAWAYMNLSLSIPTIVQQAYNLQYEKDLHVIEFYKTGYMQMFNKADTLQLYLKDCNTKVDTLKNISNKK